MTGPVAKRYARALFALASEDGKIEAYGAELARVVETFRDKRLAALARSAAIDSKRKREMTGQVVGALGVSPRVASFVGLLAEKGRLPFLEAIGEQYERFVDRALGRVRARVRSARPLPEEDRARISELFERETGKRVLAEVSVDPDLLGGVVVEIAGRVYDGSIRTRLEAIRRALAG
jgi:F-type H+-transporting ATPase subunit delta